MYRYLFHHFIFYLFIPFFLFCDVRLITPKILHTIPHDPTAFTQGLAYLNGSLYESTGLYGESSLRQIDPLTGTVLKKTLMDPNYFSEGIAIIHNQLFQITWKEHTAFVYHLRPLKQVRNINYNGEGWGLCEDEGFLLMSNGTNKLVWRDASDFHIHKELSVTYEKSPLQGLNDLTCTTRHIYANLWPSTKIVQIDKKTGEVVGLIECATLVPKESKSSIDNVINGIAFNPESRTFFVTGKRWPLMYEVKFFDE